MDQRLVRLLARIESSKLVRSIPDRQYISINYLLRTGKRMKWSDPCTYNEKLNWMKIYDRDTAYTALADKQAVKEWVTERLGDGHVIPTLGIWNGFDEIDFDLLPDQFVLKTTHDSGGVFISLGKDRLDRREAKRFLEWHLNRNYFWHGRQWVYKDIQPRILAEPYLVDESGKELKDYKVFCFDGQPKMIQVDFGRFDTHRRNLYTTDWDYIPASIKYPSDPDRRIARPEALDELLHCAAILSEGIRHVRTDFYVIGNRILLGELTFYHGDGCEKFTPESFGYEMGNWMRID